MKRSRTLAIALLIASLLLASLPSLAETSLLPEVSEEMTAPAYWTEKAEPPDAVLAEP